MKKKLIEKEKSEFKLLLKDLAKVFINKELASNDQR